MEQTDIFENTAKHTTDACTFCKIIRGEIQSHIVFEDNVSLAFLDHQPLLHGHCLLVPKTHYETLIDLPDLLIPPLFSNAKLLARAAQESLEADGSFLAINIHISQAVPHLHIHIVPRWKKDGLFAKVLIWKREPYKDKESVLKIRDSLKSAIVQLRAGQGET